VTKGTPLDAELIGEEVGELRRQVAPDLFHAFEPSAFPHSSLPTLDIARVHGQLRITTNEDSLTSFLDAALHP
jgi:hypothetical protein